MSTSRYVFLSAPKVMMMPFQSYPDFEDRHFKEVRPLVL